MTESKFDRLAEEIEDGGAELDGIVDMLRSIERFRDADKVESFADAVSAPSIAGDSCFYRVERLTYEKDRPRREAFENTLAGFSDRGFNFVYILVGEPDGVELYVGVTGSGKPSSGVLNAVDLGDKLANMIRGNFGGSELTRVTGHKLSEMLLSDTGKYGAVGAIVGVPSVNDSANSDEQDFQGVDRLINSMAGETWRMVVIVEPVGAPEIRRITDQVYEIYDKVSYFAKETRQSSANVGRSDQIGTSEGTSSNDSKNGGYSKNDSEQSGSSSGSSSSSTNHSKSHQEGTSEGWSKAEGTSMTSSRSATTSSGASLSMTRERANKRAQELMRYIDDELLKRLRIGRTKGLFRVSVRYMAADPKVADRLRSSITALYQGSDSSFSGLSALDIELPSTRRGDMLASLRNHSVDRGARTREAAIMYSRPAGEDGMLGVSTYLTPGEVALFAGLPQKEVPGIALSEIVDFGLNGPSPGEDAVVLGPMIQRGRRLNGAKFALARGSMNKHIFVGGVTGGGKTTTCHRLLRNAGMPFLVIEPAKTEYRSLLNDEDFDDMIVLTPGSENTAPFRINPFELMQGEGISSHIDLIRAAFTSSFRMEASMPQLMEEAIIACYEDKGWDVVRNTNRNEPVPAAYLNDDLMPTMSDLVSKLEVVVKEKNFGDRLGSEYLGSLVSRISNLTKGVKGEMLNCARGVDFAKLVRGKVVIEMEEMRSPEDKALLMGFILTRVATAVRFAHESDETFRHLTLIEEAHRLLSRQEPGEPSSRKSAVETFSDLLAEVRKYGEGLVIVDQIPSKLAPEVLKNTNTKIIHKLFARDDKDAVGDTMLMDEQQRDHLSALSAGDAVVFSDEMDKPILIHVDYDDRDRAISGERVANADVKRRFERLNRRLGDFRNINASEARAELPTHLDLMKKLALELKFAPYTDISGTLLQHINDHIKRLCEIDRAHPSSRSSLDLLIDTGEQMRARRSESRTKKIREMFNGIKNGDKNFADMRFIMGAYIAR